uniref:Putative membrane protein n=1 Tax=Nyssomyia neivai TaxID=330878 RepID=A0A1L8D9Z4_9DIPT
MPIFNKCCCCIALPTGGIILGVLGAINSLIGIILPILALIHLDNFFDTIQEDRNNNFNEPAVIGRDVFNMTDDEHPPPTKEQIEIARLLLKIILVVIVIVNVFVLLSSIFLIVGAKTKRKEFILPYLISDAFGIGFMILYFINNAINGPSVAQGIFSALIYLLLAGYLWLCVFSLYQWIKENNRPPPTVRTHYPEQQAVYSTMA